VKQAFGSRILDAAARLLIPYILLFALYVLFHGHHSPGGGFQGGTILAAAVILIRLVRGRQPGWGIGREQALILALIGVLIYASFGFSEEIFSTTAIFPFPHLRPKRDLSGYSVLK